LGFNHFLDSLLGLAWELILIPRVIMIMIAQAQAASHAHKHHHVRVFGLFLLSMRLIGRFAVHGDHLQGNYVIDFLFY
jgi:hypothetical protein